MDQVLVDALSGIAVPAGIFIVGLLIALVNRFTKDRVVVNIKTSAEALAALPDGGHEIARAALIQMIEMSGNQLAARNRPGRLRTILVIVSAVIGLAAAIAVSIPVISNGNFTTVSTYATGVLGLLAMTAILRSGIGVVRIAARQVQEDVAALRDKNKDPFVEFRERAQEERDRDTPG